MARERRCSLRWRAPPARHFCCVPSGRCSRKIFPSCIWCSRLVFTTIMAFTFGRSLRKGSVPLCTQLADRVHGPLSALELRYTRGVTLAWVIFFLLNLAATFLLFEFAPLRAWSIFVNFCSLPLILLMFAAEYAVRRRVLPQVQGSGLMATLRVYFAHSPQK